MNAQPEKKSRRKLPIILAVLLLSILIGCRVIIYRVIGTPEPPEHIVISSKDNLCLDFTGNPGTQENLIMFTHYCDVELRQNDLGPDRFDKESYLYVQDTIECPWVVISDINGDGFQEIRTRQDPICKAFAHWNIEPTDVTYRIERDGKIVAIESR